MGYIRIPFDIVARDEDAAEIVAAMLTRSREPQPAPDVSWVTTCCGCCGYSTHRSRWRLLVDRITGTYAPPAW